ncbi:GIY-YIG nuclease family protein [Flavobacterium filum]|uniref:GIY-YIG nuclease family protein n=1 Tax=Flavobacterium filum TaxID=370974 RepID=UPI0004269476|nr:GIY-YIG nuclease family protein [Flavobacterium filum]
MSHFIYILYSETTSKYYIGESYNLDERIKNHNQHFYQNSFSKIANDWKLLLSYECIDRHSALYLERFIKKMKSRLFIEKIISNPEILSDILSKRK